MKLIDRLPLLHRGGGTSDSARPALQASRGRLSAAGRSNERFELLTVDEVLALPDPDWLIEEVFPASSIAQLYGKSGLGKTFVALDAALSVAAGVPWLGTYQVRQGRVVYVAAEGHRGMKARLQAWLAHHGLDAEGAHDFRLLGEPVQLGSEDDIGALIRQVERTFSGRELGLVVLDTQARCTVGLDENSAKEMGLALEAADHLKRTTGATVLLLHHTGYEGDHARGSTAVHAALDSQVSLGGPRKALELSCTKQKDWEEFSPIRVVLVRVGESLVPVTDAADAPARLKINEAHLSDRQEQALRVLRDYPDGLRAQKWAKKASLPHSTFYEAVKQLGEKGLVKKEGKHYLAAQVHDRSGIAGPESNGTGSPEVQRSTTPLGGGPLDREASDTNARGMAETIQAAMEEARGK